MEEARETTGIAANDKSEAVEPSISPAREATDMTFRTFRFWIHISHRPQRKMERCTEQNVQPYMRRAKRHKSAAVDSFPSWHEYRLPEAVKKRYDYDLIPPSFYPYRAVNILNLCIATRIFHVFLYGFLTFLSA